MNEEVVFVSENILTKEVLDYLPQDSQQKLQTWQKQLRGEYVKQKAARKCYDERQREMQSEIVDLEVKLQKSVENVNELRIQLDNVSNERNNLVGTVKKYEGELGTLRVKKKSITEERDILLRNVERQKRETEYLQTDLSTAGQELRTAIFSKCEIIVRHSDIESKELALKLKEQLFEQESAMLKNRIQSLCDDLKRVTNDLLNTRQHNLMEKMHIDIQLNGKTEEVRILETQCNQLRVDNAELNEELKKCVRNTIANSKNIISIPIISDK